MPNNPGGSAPPDSWVLIRRARQLLTLHGPNGPRRGPAMQDLHVISDGSVLIHNGLIEETGPTQRIENLQKARGAREIDAAGKIVMPAFVDPDAGLVASPTQPARAPGETKEISLGVLSKRRLEGRAVEAATAWVRHGSLTVGAHSGYAADQREVSKVLRIHKELQGRPLRIRSILSPRKAPDVRALIDKCLPAMRKANLASILELTAGAEDGLSSEALRAVALAAATIGYALRIRAPLRLTEQICALALDTGALAIVSGAPPLPEYARQFSLRGCIHILSARALLDADVDTRKQLRAALAEGAAVALASHSQTTGVACCNFQHLLHMAREHCGMSDAEAIVAATWNAACSLRMSHVAGSIEPGKKADLLVMDVPDYRDLARRAGHSDVHVAMRSGQVVYRRAGLILD